MQPCPHLLHPHPQSTNAPLAAGVSSSPTKSTAACPQGGGKHLGLENTGSVPEGLSGEFFNDGLVFTIALLV